MLKILLLHALQINPAAWTSRSHPMTMIPFREAVNEEDWRALLGRALNGIQKVCIILDADLISHAMNNNSYSATRWFGAFSNLATKTVLNIFIPAFAIDTGYEKETGIPPPDLSFALGCLVVGVRESYIRDELELRGGELSSRNKEL